MGSEDEGADPAPPNATYATGEDWRKALDHVVPCCVVLKTTVTRAFDTESASSSYATGFVVDKARGLILTNRHVVKPGPVVAEAVFLNREEIPVYPLYRDPVHDFGFMRFDPKLLQFMDVNEVELAPEAAHVGLEVRVVGNDSGEKVSILAGTIARLDRDAPAYSKIGYNDFNTFYLQAASGTKGGSSGSPVVNSRGQAIALNAGSKTKSSSAFFYPLHRVVRALDLIRGHQLPTGSWTSPVVPRGTLQTTLSYMGFDEVRRLGFRRETEAQVRAEAGDGETGMLVVESVCPGGPAAGWLEPGDVLVRLAGRVVTQFRPMEELFDDLVGSEVEVEVERGGRALVSRLKVQDLHSITPSSFLEVCGGTVHALSYQQARNSLSPVGQVYVAEPGYMLSRAGVPKHAIITAVDGQATRNLEEFAGQLQGLPHGKRVPLEYYVFAERHRRKNVLLQMDRRWYGPPLYWERDDASGLWSSTTGWPLGSEADGPMGGGGLLGLGDSREMDVDTPEGEAGGGGGGGENGAAAVPAEVLAEAAAPPPDSDPVAESLLRSLVLVTVDVPPVALADGVHSKSFEGSGLVVHHGEHLGLVLVDRNTVPIGPVDVMLSFGAHPAEIPARVMFLHPIHNFAVVGYDPRALDKAARAAVRPALLQGHPLLRRGDRVHLVGLSHSMRPVSRVSNVTNAAAAVCIPSAEVPRFRAVHEEVVELDMDFGQTFSGVLTGDEGEVRALWGSYAKQVKGDEHEFVRGLPAAVVAPWVDALRGMGPSDPLPALCSPVLNAELEPSLLSKAASYGLTPEWVQKLAAKDPERKQVLRVRSCVASSHAASVLREGDMVLAVDAQPVSCFLDVETRAAAHCAPVAGAASNAAAAAHLPGGGGSSSSKEEGPQALVGSAPPDVGPLQLTIFRQKVLMDVMLNMGFEDGLGTGRLVHWAGAQLQAPHRGVRELGYLPEGSSGVYVSRWHHGSPAHRYRLYALHWVTSVNDIPTPDLDTFLRVVAQLEHGSFVRVKVVHLNTKPKVLSLRLDLHYWPTWELRLDPATGEWNRTVLQSHDPTQEGKGGSGSAMDVSGGGGKLPAQGAPQ